VIRQTAFHRRQIDGGGLPIFWGPSNVKPFITSELELVVSSPILYRSRPGAKTARADMLMRGLAHVGIIALVDEATGYQEVRDRRALEAILDRFLRKELAAWARRFPDEFYQQIFRLKEWAWKGMAVNRPSVVGKYTNDLVYERLAPNILAVAVLAQRTVRTLPGDQSPRGAFLRDRVTPSRMDFRWVACDFPVRPERDRCRTMRARLVPLLVRAFCNRRRLRVCDFFDFPILSRPRFIRMGIARLSNLINHGRATGNKISGIGGGWIRAFARPVLSPPSPLLSFRTDRFAIFIARLN
jgi:hypothetical protein